MNATLTRASGGFLLRHPWQLGLALAGIAVGVAVIVAVDLANISSQRAFDLSMDTINGEATHQIVAGPMGVDENIYTQLRLEGKVRRIAPIVEGYAIIGERTFRLLGVDIFAERDFRTYTLADSIVGDDETYRQLLLGGGAVLIADRAASSLGLAKDDQVTLSVGGKAHEAYIAGIIEGEAAAATRLDDLMIVDIAVAQVWLDMIGRLTRIDVRLPEREDATATLDRIQSFLPPGTEVLSAAGRTESVTQMSQAFTTNLTAMSLLALLVGVFLIYNSVGFTVLQRRELIGILRALGVTRRQVFGLLLTEGLALGLAGVTLGCAFGVLLGNGLVDLVSRTINDHYFVVTVTEVQWSALSLSKGALAGLGAAAAAVLVPAAEAANYPPRLTLTRSSLEQRARSLVPGFAVTGGVILGAAGALLAISGRNLIAGLTALFMLILGFALMIPLAVRWSGRLVSPLAALTGGSTGRLAIAGVITSLSRTAVAIVALAVAISATIGVSVMVDSFRQSVSDWLGNALRSDLYISAPGPAPDRTGGEIDAGLVSELLNVDGIVDHSASRSAWIESQLGRTRVLAVDLAPAGYGGFKLRQGAPDEVWRAFSEEGAVVVSDAYAYRYGTLPGDTVALNTASGVRRFPVAGIYQSYDTSQGAVLMHRSTYLDNWHDTAITSLGLYLGPDADPESVRDRLFEASTGRQQLLIRSDREIRELSLAVFDRTFVITDVLYWLAIVVAFIGILSAMLALQLERGKDMAILRALGMTPAQVGGLVSLQTAFMGLMAGVMALPLGLMMAWVLIEVINRRAFGWHIDAALSGDVLISALAMSIVAALLAGLYPAWRAATVSPASAMRED